MKFTIEKIGAALPVLLAAAQRERVALGPARMARAPQPGAQRPDYDDREWETLTVGDRWGRRGETYWLRLPVRVPASWTDGRIAIHIALSDYQDLSGPEALAYLDGVPLQGIDYYHRDLVLDGRYRDGCEHLLALEAYSSLGPGPQTLRALDLVWLDPDVVALYHDMRVLLGVVQTMPEDALARVRMLRVLDKAYNVLNLQRPLGTAFRESVARAREMLRRKVYEHGARGERPRTIAVGHAHIDLAWLWPVAQTRRKGARTFSTVLKLMEEYPDYHFVASQPALYQIVKEDEPAIYEGIKRRIAEGRWEPTGASWVEMDCNLTGSESLVRQFLFGKRYFRQELGVDPRILWLPDVFGYAAALPQVLKGCAVDYFMTTKISWNEYNRLPYDTFRWRGIDGTEVLTHMVTAPLNPHELEGSTMQPFYTYNAKFTPYDVAGNWRAYRQKGINHELLYLFGYGDGGGGPTAEMQETAMRMADLPEYPQVEQSPAEAFFRRLDERVWNDPDLPTWVGELYLEYHRGTYTSQAAVKRANRKAELLYREAELWTVLAGLTGDVAMARQQETLNRGWESILFNQFHDILPGSSIHEVYEDALADFDRIVDVGEGVRTAALHRLGAAVAASRPVLLALNPAPFERDDPIETVLPPGMDVADEEGRVLPVQDLVAFGDERRVLVAATAPALGYRTLTLRENDGSTATVGSDLQVSRNVLENRFFRLELDDKAEIVSLFDKRAGREVIAPEERGNRFIAFEDRPLNFDAWDINIYYQDKPYPVDDVTSWKIVETGPLRGGVEITRRFGASTITQRILLYRDVPRIDFPTQVDWHERQTLLKVAFPVTVNSPRATFEIQWGNVERPTHWNTSWDWARFETCAHKWIDLSEGDYGVSLLNDCKYGHDVQGHTMRLTLIKSAIWPDPEADQGHHEFSYALLPHVGDWREGQTVEQAYLFNMPAAARFVPPHNSAGNAGTLPPAASLVSTDRPGLVIETIKPAEDGDGIIVRIYEAHNTRGEATLTFGYPIASAEETNMLEERQGPAAFDGHRLRVPVRPYGISTFRVRLATS